MTNDQAQGLREAFAQDVEPVPREDVILLAAAGGRSDEGRARLATELRSLGARVESEGGCRAPPAFALLLVDADPIGVTRGLEALARIRARWLLRGVGVAVNGVDAGCEGIAAFRGLVTLARSRNLDVQLEYLGHVRGAREGFKLGTRGSDFLLDLEAGMPSDTCIRFVARRAVAACPRGIREFWRALLEEGDA